MNKPYSWTDINLKKYFTYIWRSLIHFAEIGITWVHSYGEFFQQMCKPYFKEWNSHIHIHEQMWTFKNYVDDMLIRLIHLYGEDCLQMNKSYSWTHMKFQHLKKLHSFIWKSLYANEMKEVFLRMNKPYAWTNVNF